MDGARNSLFSPGGLFYPGYFGFLAVSAGRATPHGSYFSLGCGILSSAALYAFSSTPFRGSVVEPGSTFACLCACAGIAIKASSPTAIIKVFIACLPAIPIPNLPCGRIKANPGLVRQAR